MALAKKTAAKKPAGAAKKAASGGAGGGGTVAAKKTAAKKASAKRAASRKGETMGKLKVGNTVTVLVDPRMNNGSDEAVGVVVRVWSDEMVNLRVLCDGPETLWLTSVNVVKKRPDFPAGEQPPRVCFK